MCEITDRFWDEITKSAAERRIEFYLSREDAWKQFLIQHRRCALTRDPLEMRSKGYRGNASLNRIDSKKIYTLDNIEWVTVEIQLMLGEMRQSRFKEACYKVCHPAPYTLEDRVAFLR